MNGSADSGGDGRSQSFGQGVQEVAQSSAHTVQQANGGVVSYHPQSIIDQPSIMKSTNGMSVADHDRMTMGGGMLPSANGQSKDTYQKGQWLTSPYRTFG